MRNRESRDVTTLSYRFLILWYLTIQKKKTSSGGTLREVSNLDAFSVNLSVYKQCGIVFCYVTITKNIPTLDA